MDRPNDPRSAIAGNAAEPGSHLVAIRRDPHAHPALAFTETRTYGAAAELARLGIPHRTGIGRSGLALSRVALDLLA